MNTIVEPVPTKPNRTAADVAVETMLDLINDLDKAERREVLERFLHTVVQHSHSDVEETHRLHKLAVEHRGSLANIMDGALKFAVSSPIHQ